MNYDELVKELRHYFYDDPLVLDAADAIEELQQTAKHYKGCADDWYKEACDYKALVPKWIPVTERLPKGEAERYLVAADFMAYGLWVSICYYADNLEEVDEYDFSGERHGGFYGYDSEYGHYEKNGVKYWMPLPEPPKEET